MPKVWAWAMGIKSFFYGMDFDQRRGVPHIRQSRRPYILGGGLGGGLGVALEVGLAGG